MLGLVFGKERKGGRVRVLVVLRCWAGVCEVGFVALWRL